MKGGYTYHDLTVVLLDLHLHIKACKLSHVPGRVGVLGSENGPNTEYTLAATGNLDLLVKLR